MKRKHASGIVMCMCLLALVSGGAGACQHIVDAFTRAHADAAIVASMVHTGEFTIAQIKDALLQAGIPVRRRW